MQAAFPNDPAVKAIAPHGATLGKAIENTKAEDAGKTLSSVVEWLRANPQPAVTSVYKGDDKAVVLPRAAEAP